MNFEYLQDKLFLNEIDNLKIKNKYAKITLLDWDENPIKDIQGIAPNGNINIDGSSSMRRTGNINIIIEDDINDITNLENDFSINKKIKVFIGIKNETNKYKNYDIIWFPQGVFVISGCSLSRDSNGLNMSLSIKDKMCLLNGNSGGILPAAITFNEYEMVDNDGEIIIKYPTIYRIILELVNHWGGEPLHKIIISDLNERIQKIMKWTGDKDLYLYRQDDEDTNSSYSVTTDLSNIDENTPYKTYTYGDDIGYEYTDFIYTDDLVCNAGDSITSILDKIIEYLGNYEYFYDIEGNFIFQEKKNFLNVSQSTVKLNTIDNNESYLLDMNESKSVYDFTDKNIISAYSNNPNYENIKNDFIVWGQRKTADDSSVPIRYHLSIDSKPNIGNEYNIFLVKDSFGNKKAKVPRCFDTFESFPDKENGNPSVYYMDKSTNKIYTWADNEYTELIDANPISITTEDWRTELYLQGASSEKFGIQNNYYFAELENEWPKIYDLENQKIKEDILNNQTGLDYYLDFIDSTASISEFEISNIGRRTQVMNNDKVNCIFEPEIPNFVFIDITDEKYDELVKECIDNDQDYIQVSNEIFSYIHGGGNNVSAFSAVRELLYQYTNYNETITLTTIPIYHLEPNSRIAVKDSKTDIAGDYIISSISVPFDVQSTMSITATRALERF